MLLSLFLLLLVQVAHFVSIKPNYLHSDRMKIFNSTSKELEDVRDDDLYMWPKFNNRRINQEADSMSSNFDISNNFSSFLHDLMNSF